jgi:hypothetical protein
LFSDLLTPIAAACAQSDDAFVTGDEASMHRQRPALFWIAFGIATLVSSICCSAASAQNVIWPTKGWETSSPELQGMDSRALADLVNFGASEKMDSLLVTRHGRIVTEAYYAPFRAGINIASIRRPRPSPPH